MTDGPDRKVRSEADKSTGSLDLKIPSSIPELFRYAAKRYQRSDALVYKHKGEWVPLSSEEFIERSEAIAYGLLSLGLEKGDRVAILAPNSPHWTLADAGCQFAAILDVPIYTTLAHESIKFILNNSETKAIFLQNAESANDLKDIFAECGSLEHVIIFEGAQEEISSQYISLISLEARGREYARSVSENHLLDIQQAVKPDDIATLIYTSGTTGEPKGVMLSHSNIVSNVVDAGEKYSFTSDDRPLSVLPLSHIFERSAMYLYFYNGMAIHYAESIEKVPENLADVKPSILVGVPRIFEKVYAKAKLKAAQGGTTKEKIFDWAIETAKTISLTQEQGRPLGIILNIKHFIADKLVYAKFRQFFGGRLRMCITGGAALPDDIYLIFTGAGVPIMQGYGLTETSPVITSNNPRAVRLGSSGKAIRNMQVRIAEDGEVEAFGPGVMLGYYKNPEATKEVFTEDGWFKTGDIGRLNPDGFLFITDRKKELFKTSGGKYIAPSPIEQMIRGSRFVNQAVLVGNARKFAAALIVPNFEMLDSYANHKGMQPMSPAEYCSDPKIQDLFERQISAVTKGLAKFETVKKFRLLDKEMTVETGELTPTMKLKRRVIDQKYKEIIDEMYEDPLSV